MGAVGLLRSPSSSEGSAPEPEEVKLYALLYHAKPEADQSFIDNFAPRAVGKYDSCPIKLLRAVKNGRKQPDCTFEKAQKQQKFRKIADPFYSYKTMLYRFIPYCFVTVFSQIIKASIRDNSTLSALERKPGKIRSFNNADGSYKLYSFD